jgi:hypothetical protein
VTDRGGLRIDLRCEGDVPTVTTAFDLHVRLSRGATPRRPGGDAGRSGCRTRGAHSRTVERKRCRSPRALRAASGPSCCLPSQRRVGESYQRMRLRSDRPVPTLSVAPTKGGWRSTRLRTSSPTPAEWWNKATGVLD